MSNTKAGQTLAKLLGIKLQYRNELGRDVNDLSRGESVYSVSSADTYVEEEPTVVEWLQEILPGGHGMLLYLYHLFPFTHWITRYNLQWLYGDLIAGITVGCVVVPQSMAYALLANLAPEFGLYSSFMGVLIYWFFATSKDITIGPVAVLSTVTGTVVNKVYAKNKRYPKNEIASALAVISGSVVLFIGLVRCGWFVEFISLAAISAFMTGSAINIAAGQVPTMMGITGFSTRDATYKVIINTLKHLGRTKLDAAMGLTALLMLYLIRFACNTAAKKQPKRAKMWFLINTLRTAFVILLYVLISYLANRHHRAKPKFKILGNVPRGFQHAKVPTINKNMVKSFLPQLPVTVVVLLIEHIAIAKSFGRVNNYTINPSQELVAIGVTNVLGPFLGAYPATGSFSRTAIKSKAGVRTPFAGVITALVVLLAIYALPAAFFYIPSASLSAVIIHAVGDLITPPNVIYQFWRVSPLEVGIFFLGVFVTIFSNIENGIYCTVGVSAGMLLFRVVKAKGRFLGRVKAHSVLSDRSFDNTRSNGANNTSVRNIFLPINHHDGSNPSVDIEAPYPGIFIYRFSEGYNYPNANHYLDYLSETIFANTRRTNLNHYPKPGDRPWNDPGPRRGQVEEINEHLPTLKAVILDFSSVNNVDVTSVQLLIDVRNQLDRYASPNTVDWHIACINNRWTRRALAAAGFGYPTPAQPEIERWKPVFSVAEIGGHDNSAAAAAQTRDNELARKHLHDEEIGQKETVSDGSSSDKDFSKELSTAKAYAAPRTVLLSSINRPFFHLDLTSALQSAIHNAESRAHSEAKGVGTEVY